MRVAQRWGGGLGRDWRGGEGAREGLARGGGGSVDGRTIQAEERQFFGMP